jgi:hypothetical protein
VFKMISSLSRCFDCLLLCVCVCIASRHIRTDASCFLAENAASWTPERIQNWQQIHSVI